MAASSRRSSILLVVLVSAAAVARLPPCSGSPAEAKVSLELYYESLCPYCSRFIVNHLAGIFEDGLIAAVDLSLVPYGNAHVVSNDTVSCQLWILENLISVVYEEADVS
ncbi:hypothetical protein GUJ93_ZPchr0013g34170 [Zizania palustris]|uniref:Uncharacterized protein n=1 Tax=Zizania palustris TaxID=103762 RepID=A0A8J6BXH0_ZIZPA|nr:hypothetical protein GUJ93_ZPchr0013g34170 [Zizania palustris]